MTGYTLMSDDELGMNTWLLAGEPHTPLTLGMTEVQRFSVTRSIDIHNLLDTDEVTLTEILKSGRYFWREARNYSSIPPPKHNPDKDQKEHLTWNKWVRWVKVLVFDALSWSTTNPGRTKILGKEKHPRLMKPCILKTYSASVKTPLLHLNANIIAVLVKVFHHAAAWNRSCNLATFPGWWDKRCEQFHPWLRAFFPPLYKLGPESSRGAFEYVVRDYLPRNMIWCPARMLLLHTPKSHEIAGGAILLAFWEQ
jgi:hypothetical protein